MPPPRLGPNGAGKTTMVRVLATLLPPDAGQALVGGFDVVRQRREVRRLVSLTGQYAAVDGLQTGAENLRLMARLAGLTRQDARRRAIELLERFCLADAGDRKVATYSGGMLRRLDLAASLVGDPQVIFLDEPTTGLDVRSRQGLWGEVRDLAASGVTVFLTTQYLEEADRLADRIAVLDGGDVLAEGTSAELKERVAAQRLDLVLADTGAVDEAVRVLDGRVVHRDAHTGTVGVATDGSAAHVRSLLDEVDPAGRSIRLSVRNMDALFTAMSVAAVIAVAYLVGFRAEAGLFEWLGGLGVLLAFIVAMSAVSAAVGLVTKSPEAASGFTFFVLFLPYPSSAFVPIETMPTWLHGFAENQPATPVIESVRALLLDLPLEGHTWAALAWSGGILLVSVVLAGVFFARRTR